jgi:pre-mRNA-splicing factor ISY1
MSINVRTFLFCHIESALTLKEKTRAELHRNVDADYYGYRDEEDGTLLEFEEEQERIGT